MEGLFFIQIQNVVKIKSLRPIAVPLTHYFLTLLDN